MIKKFIANYGRAFVSFSLTNLLKMTQERGLVMCSMLQFVSRFLLRSWPNQSLIGNE